jgi:pimeloyl-ACP methyl ester carboxylesterase
MSVVVLVHGAYQGGWIWGLTARALRSSGHEVYAPTLDGCAERAQQLRQGITTESQAAELAEFLRYFDLREVVLVGTSTGGMVAAATAELARDRIGRIVFADALALMDGEALPDIVTRNNPITTELSTGPQMEDARDRLFADLDEATRAWTLERTTLHPLATMIAPVRLATFWQQSWDAHIIWCKRSANPPHAHQRRAADQLSARWSELDTGHYPMLEAPVELAALIASV